MSDIAIKVENLSKAYQLGDFGTGSLTRDIERWWALTRGKEDPFLKIGETNDRTLKGESDIVWSLKDIDFEIKQGDAVGIIGRNGAGKSTLLKVLSRVTSPSTGNIKVKGRIASLLEVGTGFHPELTGGENIYLNGAIMGMSKREIKKKFDEIVDFAGVERYVDTPVKRYSSGMYVRLAFAVAAHLESEILIVDEVLAVGDADFQKKCLGKMNDVSKGEGRTVLFVSHNMASIATLCTTGMVLSNGQLKYVGDIESAISVYTDREDNGVLEKKYTFDSAPGNSVAKILEVSVSSIGNKNNYFDVTEDIVVTVKYYDCNIDNISTAIIHVKDARDNVLFASNEFNNGEWKNLHNEGPNIVTATCTIPGNYLAEGKHSILAAIGSYSPNVIHAIVDNVVAFEVVDTLSGSSVKRHVPGSWPGLVRPMLKWDILLDKYVAH
jgi:lipopolysaccharide transport system ATP-binding protein